MVAGWELWGILARRMAGGLSDAEVKRAFKAAAKRLHPDLFQAPGEKASAEAAFKNVLTAYQALKGAVVMFRW